MAIVLIKQIWIIVNSVNNVLHCSKENKHKASDNSEINDAGLNEKTCGENQSRAPPPAVKCVHCESPRDKQNDGNKHSLPQLLVSFRLSPIDLLKTSKCAFWINPLILLYVTRSGGNDSGQWLEGFSAQIERLSILKGSHAAVKAGAEGSIIVF